MKAITVIMSILINLKAYGSLVNVKQNFVYIGKESYQSHETGAACFVQILKVRPYPKKGQHCQELTIKFGVTTNQEITPSHYEMKMISRITNYHHDQYPEMKNCAEPVENVDARSVIYGESTELLYNQLFNWNEKIASRDHHFTLIFSSITKGPSRFRLHSRTWFTDRTWDCEIQ